ncbi:MAG: hypothetical protein ABWZ26_02020 [Candidatus Nanopelagicales bacterium]
MTAMRRFIYKHEYVRPTARRISDGVIMRLDHVYEVDPDLMGRAFSQQNMPRWDTERIVSSRNDHLSWMHEHFADETLVAGEPEELDLGPGGPAASADATTAGEPEPASHPAPIVWRRPWDADG